jgi:ZIP family zinc transporter
LISAWLVFAAALLSDLATGLGAFPVLLLRRVEPRWHAVMTGVASGMMVSASIFALADKALRRGAALDVMGGMLAGAAFVAWSAHLLEKRRWGLSALLIWTLFVHSIPEGLAIGVGYATGEVRFGWLLAIAIAVHNIPEGTAVALPLRAEGASVVRCVGYAILTSLPQPIVAVPAFMLISLFQPLLAASLGFAGGAMIFLVVAELIPEALASGSRTEIGWSVTVGLVAMLGFIALLGL